MVVLLYCKKVFRPVNYIFSVFESSGDRCSRSSTIASTSILNEACLSPRHVKSQEAERTKIRCCREIQSTKDLALSSDHRKSDFTRESSVSPWSPHEMFYLMPGLRSQYV